MFLVWYLRNRVQKRGQPQNLRRVHAGLTETRLEHERSPLALLQLEVRVTKNSRQELMRPPQLAASFISSGRAMSPSGTFWTCRSGRCMSASEGKADVPLVWAEVCF